MVVDLAGGICSRARGPGDYVCIEQFGSAAEPFDIHEEIFIFGWRGFHRLVHLLDLHPETFS